jgi:hypothetical protein
MRRMINLQRRINSGCATSRASPRCCATSSRSGVARRRVAPVLRDVASPRCRHDGFFFFPGVIAGLFFTGSINHGFICLVVLWSGAGFVVAPLVWWSLSGLVVAQRLPRTTTAYFQIAAYSKMRRIKEILRYIGPHAQKF